MSLLFAVWLWVLIGFCLAVVVETLVRHTFATMTKSAVLFAFVFITILWPLALVLIGKGYLSGPRKG